MPLGLECPSCHHAFHVPNNMSGRVIKCPRCEHSFAAVAEYTPTGPINSAVPGGTAASPGLFDRNELPRPTMTEPAGGADQMEPGAPQPAPTGPEEPARVAPGIAVAPPPAVLPPMARFTTMTPAAAAPLPAPPRPQRRLTSLVVDLPGAVVRHVSGGAQGIVTLALIALVLGLAAWAVMVWARLSLLSVGLGAIGILLGGVGIAALVVRKEKGVALPLAATLVNVQALLFAVLASAETATSTPHQGGEPTKKPPTTVKVLRDKLISPDRDTRLDAVFALNDLAKDLKTSAPELMALLQDEQQPAMRAAAAEALGQIGPEVRISYPMLVELEGNDSNENVRNKAKDAYLRIGPPGNADVPMLLDQLKDQKAKNPLLRAAAALGLGMVAGETRLSEAALKRALQEDGDANVRVSAARSLWSLQGKQVTKQVLDVFTDNLKDNDVLVRSRAAEGLALMGVEARPAAVALARLLQDPSVKVRWQAAFALTTLGPAAQQTVPQLNSAIVPGGNPKVRLYAAVALWAIDRQPQAIPVLADGLKLSEIFLRQTAAAQLKIMAERAKGKPKELTELAGAVPALCAALKDSDPLVRGNAMNALRAIGPDSRAVKPLIAALQHHDPDFRANAAFTLERFGPAAKEAVAALKTALDDKVPAVQVYAARVLWSVQGKAKEVIPTLKRLLEDKVIVVRARAAFALGNLKGEAAEAVPALNEALKDANDPTLQAAAVEALGQIGPAARACYPKLTELERDKDVNEVVRKAAGAAHKKIGRPTRADVDLLIRGLKQDQPAGYRAAAAVTLWMLNREARPAAKALSKALEDPDESVSTTAAYALAAIGPDAAAEGAVSALAAALGNKKSSELRSRAAYALGEMGTKAKDAVEALNAVLAKDKEGMGVRLHAAQALWSIDHQTKDVVKVLSEAVQDKEVEAEQRALAATTLGKIGAKEEAKLVKELVVPALIKVLSDDQENLGLRNAAAAALGTMGVKGSEGVAALILALRETDPGLRLATIDALARIGVAEQKAKVPVRARVAIAALAFTNSVDPNLQVRQEVSAALTKIGQPTGADVPMLLGVLENPENPLDYRTAAGQVLGMLGPDEGKTAVPGLIKSLTDKELGVRLLVASALAGIGQNAVKALPALIEAAKDGDPGMRAAAVYALGEIGPSAGNPVQVRAALETALTDMDESVRDKAKEALKKVKAAFK